MASEERSTPSILSAILKAEDLQAQDAADRIVQAFFRRWGADIFAAEKPPASDDQRPLILTVDFFSGCDGLLEQAGYRVSFAWSGRVMLAKVRALAPRLIITGLNVLHAYPPAHRWMLANISRRDGIPVLFVTGASARRLPLEVPASPRARVLEKPPAKQDLLRAVSELL